MNSFPRTAEVPIERVKKKEEGDVAKSSNLMIERRPRSIIEKIRKESSCFGNPSGFLAYFNNAFVLMAV